MTLLTLDIEKPAAGGRMIARHDGKVVLVSGAIPGERVSARLERSERGVAFADVVDVLSPSPDRRRVAGDARCGGNAFAHIDYPRQLLIKAEIVQDAFTRIGRASLPEAPRVTGSPEHGYRMRARLHVRGGVIGFFLEGTHEICDAAATGQLLPETSGWVRNAERALSRARLQGVTAIEIAENIPGSERACHLELRPGANPGPYGVLSSGLVGLSAQPIDRARAVTLAGEPAVTDTIRVVPQGLTLVRNVKAFFQGNRFLVDELVRVVTGFVPTGAVVDLFAGVGLFGLSLAAAGREPVTVVEGDRISGSDLVRNAAPFGDRVRAERRSVEDYLASAGADLATFIVDPPRTGLSQQAARHLVRLRPPRIVYVSCDVATLARDTRTLTGAGYSLVHVSGIDLFPNTAHVETVAVLSR